MNYKYALLAISGCLIFSHSASATDVSKFYCSQFHKGVRKVIFTYDANLPTNKIDWEKVLPIFKNSSESILKQGNISVEIYTSAKDVPPLGNGDLLITSVYSYAPRNAFSIPLQYDHLVNWLETSRFLENAKGQKELAVQKSKPSFLISYGNLEGEEFKLATAAADAISNLSCDIIRFSVGIDCVNRKDLKKQQFKKIEPCIDDVREKDEIDKFLEKEGGWQ